ncbi:MAG: amidohydrolase family protein [Candidatus Binatia bacterium]
MALDLTFSFVSADGHVVEPADLWTTRMDRRFRDRAPHIDAQPQGDFFVIDGVPPLPIGIESVAIEDKIAGRATTPQGRHDQARPGASDPAARLVDQELDHLRAEVIYPNLGLALGAAPDDDYVHECCRAYNDWLSEFCAAAPRRLLGVALLSLKGPVAWAAEEAQRAAKKGLCSFMIPTEVPGHSYQEKEYNRLWAALEEIGLPVALHVAAEEPFYTKVGRLGFIRALIDTKICSPERAVADLIFGAVPQRYPNLRFVIAEGGIGWIAALLRTMDHWWEDHHGWMRPKVEEKPSVYFRRQFWATFEDDRAGVMTRNLIGVDRLMWGSDYPHTEGTFPRSLEQISKDFADVPDSDVRKMVVSNAATLYRLDATE